MEKLPLAEQSKVDWRVTFSIYARAVQRRLDYQPLFAKEARFPPSKSFLEKERRLGSSERRKSRLLSLARQVSVVRSAINNNFPAKWRFRNGRGQTKNALVTCHSSADNLCKPVICSVHVNRYPILGQINMKLLPTKGVLEFMKFISRVRSWKKYPGNQVTITTNDINLKWNLSLILIT